MGRFALTAALLMVPTWAYAQPLNPLAADTKNALESIRTRIADAIPMGEALKVNAVDIQVVPNLADFSTPRAIVSDLGRSVVIPMGFTAKLWACTQANVIEDRFRTNPRTHDLWSAYDSHTWNGIQWENQQLLDMEVFASLLPGERQAMALPDFQGRVQGLFQQSLLFLFAHELGHHALDALYTANTPLSTTRAIELAADDWAVRALTAIDVVPLAGAVGSLMCLKSRGWSTYVPSLYSTHPSRAKRMQAVISSRKANWQPLYTKPPYNTQSKDVYVAMEQKLEGLVQKLVAEEDEDTVTALDDKLAGKLAKPEVIDTVKKLARHYQFGWDVPNDLGKRHALLQVAAIAGDPDAQHAVGIDYDNGIGVGIDRARAYVAYTWLALAGEKVAKTNLATLPHRSSPREVCEGKCRVGSGAASFTSCFESKRTACMTACTTKSSLGQAICEQRMCGYATNYVHWYPACVPTPEKSVEECRQQCQASTTPSATGP